MDKVATPILYSVGNIVGVEWGAIQRLAGVVLEVDHENAAKGGTMNYFVALIRDGRVINKHWFQNEELMLLDDGTATSSPTVSEAP